MNDKEKTKPHRGEAARLNEAWNVGAVQVKYNHDGHWFDLLDQFPAALFDRHGYVFFATEADYLAAPIQRRKKIGVKRPGISVMPSYVKMADSIDHSDMSRARVATESDIEGTKTEAKFLKRKRSPSLRDSAFGQANGICCVCEYDFSKLLNGFGIRVLQVHHREQLSARDTPSVSRIADLAVVCANCHMLLHMNPKKAMSVDELRAMLKRDGFQYLTARNGDVAMA